MITDTQLFYKMMSKFYDLLDVIYFRKYATSPRRVVFDSIKENDKVLDLCTGTGTVAVKIAKKRPEAKVTGVDLSKSMLHIAKDKAIKEKVENLKLYCMDATKLKFKSNCFDKVLLSLVLHETEEPLASDIIREAVRVMKDDGELIVTEWERSETLIRKIIYLPIEFMEPKPYKTFIVKDLRKYFAEFELEVVEEVHCDYSKVLKLKKVR